MLIQSEYLYNDIFATIISTLNITCLVTVQIFIALMFLTNMMLMYFILIVVSVISNLTIVCSYYLRLKTQYYCISFHFIF